MTKFKIYSQNQGQGCMLYLTVCIARTLKFPCPLWICFRESETNYLHAKYISLSKHEDLKKKHEFVN